MRRANPKLLCNMLMINILYIFTRFPYRCDISNVPNTVLIMVENSSLNPTILSVETDAEDLFDPQMPISLLLEIAQKRTLDEIVETLKTFVLSRPGVARFRMWLVDKSDNCLHTVADGTSQS